MPTDTGTATQTTTETAVAIPTSTYTPVSTDTTIPIPTATATLAPSDTGTATLVPTDTATATLVPTDTATATLPPTNTGTATLVPTDIATATLVSTDTGTATQTTTVTVTPIPTGTATSVPTALLPAQPVTVDPATLQLSTTLNLKVRQNGLYRVTYETLKASGLDLAGVPVSQITLTNRDQMLPVTVSMPDPNATTFGAGGYLEFYGLALDTLYTDTNVYTVQVSTAALVPHIPATTATPAAGLLPLNSYTETLLVNNQKAFITYSPASDIWYDTLMRVNSTAKSWSFSFTLNGLTDTQAAANMDLVVWGGSSASQNPDHHLVVAINGITMADSRFDGMIEQHVKFSIPAGTLLTGTNTLKLTLPADTGAASDIIFLDRYAISYQRTFQAQNSRLTFTGPGDVFSVTNLASPNILVYRQNANGGIIRLGNVNIQAAGTTYTASFAGTNQADTYLVTTTEALSVPTIEAARVVGKLDQPAQYLIISAPDFMTGLQPLIDAKKAQGLTVSLVNVNDLYAKYTYSIFDPQAIKSYIAYAAKNLGSQYVLLVGGDTLDYRNYLGLNGISFIPSLYTSTGPTATFIPADPMYADLNGDNVPDMAIGRLPVRSTAELSMMIAKTLAYASKPYAKTGLFVSDTNDGIVSYKAVSNSMAANLPAGWTIQNIHLDDMSLANAKTALIASMNSGTNALVNFTGHSGPQTWTLGSLFGNADAAALTNLGKPFVVVQWGCWNTYYVDPVYNYLVQKFLLSGNQGAAAVLGGTTLVDSTSEQLLGNLLSQRLALPGETLGQAMRDAKLELAKTHPELVDVMLGWSLMGDPALVVQP